MSKYLPLNLFIRQALLYPLTFPFLPPVDKVKKDYKYAAGRLTGTLVAPPARGLPKTQQTTSQRTGDDGDLEIGYPLTGPRFTDNEDNTIKDNATGLVYVNDTRECGNNFVDGGKQKAMTWADAVDACINLTYAGHNDWRLPNLKEWLAIMNYEKADPTLDDFWYFESYQRDYWTSTTDPKYKDSYAFRIKLERGFADSYSMANTLHVRPVRGPV